jgi:hypothetical protein
MVSDLSTRRDEGSAATQASGRTTQFYSHLGSGGIEETLERPKGFRSYGAIQQWLKDSLGLAVSYQAVYELVRYKLKAKLKVAKRQSIEQNPEQCNSSKLS